MYFCRNIKNCFNVFQVCFSIFGAYQNIIRVRLQYQKEGNKQSTASIDLAFIKKSSSPVHCENLKSSLLANEWLNKNQKMMRSSFLRISYIQFKRDISQSKELDVYIDNLWIANQRLIG